MPKRILNVMLDQRTLLATTIALLCVACAFAQTDNIRVLGQDANGQSVIAVAGDTLLPFSGDTLDSVTDKGATTTNAVTVGDIVADDATVDTIEASFSAGTIMRASQLVGNDTLFVIGHSGLWQIGWEGDPGLHNVAMSGDPTNGEVFIGSTIAMDTTAGDADFDGTLSQAGNQVLSIVTVPLQKSGATISIPQATSIADGFLDSVDWVLFNSKVDLGDLSATAPLTYNSGSGVFAIPQATAIADGFLDNGDWSTFNAKEPAISATTTADYYRGDKTFQALSPAVRALLSASSPVLYDSGTGVFSFDQTANNTTNDARYLKLDASNDPVTGVLTVDSLVATTADVNGGTVDGASIGSVTPGTSAFTTLSASGNYNLGDASGDTGTVRGAVTFTDATTTSRFILGNDGDLYDGGTNLIRTPDSLTVDANLVVSGNTALGNSLIDDTLTVTALLSQFNGDVTMNDGLQVSGNATFNANVTLGNATTDLITTTGRFNSDLVPSTDDARDLGTAALEWQDIFIDGTATADTLLVDENATVTGNLLVNDRIGLDTAVAADTAIAALGFGTAFNFAEESASNTGAMYAHSATSTHRPVFDFNRSRGTNGTPTVVSDNDLMGDLVFRGYGSAYHAGAIIRAMVNGSPGTNDMPSELVFFTTPDASATPAERLSINAEGALQLQETTTAPAAPDASGPWKIYAKADKLVFQFNNASTVKYWYIDGTGTSTALTYTTSAP